MAPLVSANKGKFRWLEPPVAMGGLTVADVAVADGESEPHVRRAGVSQVH
jgi:hypothetical protein